MREFNIRDRTHFTLALEILLIVMSAVYLVIISNGITWRFAHRQKKLPKCFLVDFLVLVIPLVLITTVLCNYLVIINVILLFGAILMLRINKNIEQNTTCDANRWTPVEHKTFVSNCRSVTYLLTVICILAVDFKVFPGRYHKRVRYGLALMDVGVGLFVCANGVVAPEIKKYKSITVYNTITGVLPLITLGVLRYLATTAVDYHVEETEYGVHWNFFITLAVTRLISALIMRAVTPNLKNCLLMGAAILVAHQWSLCLGLESFVFGGSARDTFVAANREGVVSTTGFVGLYFLCVSLGFLYRTRFAIVGLAISVPVLAILTVVLHQWFDISRCLANSTYCAWILFLYACVALLFNCYEKFVVIWYGVPLNFLPMLFDAINYNGLAFFLLANLSTGFVNIALKTGKIGAPLAVFILFVYAFFVCATIVFMSTKKLRIRL